MTFKDRILSFIFGPKDQFERAKKRLTRKFLVPLIALVVGPALLGAGLKLSSDRTNNGFVFILELLANNPIVLIVFGLMLCCMYCYAIFLNFRYAVTIRKEEFRLEEFELSIAAKREFLTFLEQIKVAFDCGKRQIAVALCRHLMEHQPKQTVRNVNFVKLVAENDAYTDVFGSQKLL